MQRSYVVGRFLAFDTLSPSSFLFPLSLFFLGLVSFGFLLGFFVFAWLEVWNGLDLRSTRQHMTQPAHSMVLGLIYSAAFCLSLRSGLGLFEVRREGGVCCRSRCFGGGQDEV